MHTLSNILKKSVSITLSVSIVSSIFVTNVSAAAQTFTINYNIDVQSARDMLPMINDWRTSGDAWYWNETDTKKIQCGKLGALTYDYDLEQIALQRAYEVAVMFDHMRPNGNKWSTCTYNGTRSYAENIAAGVSTAAGTFEQWQEEDDPYQFQGHRRNMLGSYKAIGIAHVIRNGVSYWVQEFGNSNSGASATSLKKGNYDRTIEADLTDWTVSLNMDTVSDITYGSVVSVPSISGSALHSETWPSLASHGIPLRSSDITSVVWSTDKTSVAKVQNGKITAAGVGSCTLTAKVTLGGKQYTLTTPVNVKQRSIADPDVTALVSDCIFDWTAQKPKPVIKYDGKTLVEGTDYTVTGYEGNDSATDTAYVKVNGKGNFNSTRKIEFAIIPRDITECTLASIPDVEYAYGGNAPSVKLTYNGKSLTMGTDFTISYDKNNVGNSEVTIVGQGNFTGRMTAGYKIVPADISKLTITSIEPQQYTGDPIEPFVAVYDGVGRLWSGFDFTIDYENNTEIGIANVILTGCGNYTGVIKVPFAIVADTSLDGWITKDGSKYYYENGVMTLGFKTIKGNRYYFSKKTGKMLTGWRELGGKKYYFNKTTGAATVDGKKISSKYYLFSTKGVMQKSGWKNDSKGNTYYLKKSGVAYTKKWYKKSGKWYYFGSNGKMVKGKSLKIGKKTYKFNSKGVCKNP